MSLDFSLLSNQNELENLTNAIDEMLGTFQKSTPQPTSENNQEIENVTANIIFNLAHLGISIEDSKNFDIETYFEIVGLEMKVINGNQSSKRATQSDINKFLL